MDSKTKIDLAMNHLVAIVSGTSETVALASLSHAQSNLGSTHSSALSYRNDGPKVR